MIPRPCPAVRPLYTAAAAPRCVLERSAGNNACMASTGIQVETLQSPVRYTYAQLERACLIAHVLNRGKLVLVEPPRR